MKTEAEIREVLRFLKEVDNTDEKYNETPIEHTRRKDRIDVLRWVLGE